MFIQHRFTPLLLPVSSNVAAKGESHLFRQLGPLKRKWCQILLPLFVHEQHGRFLVGKFERTPNQHEQWWKKYTLENVESLWFVFFFFFASGSCTRCHKQSCNIYHSRDCNLGFQFLSFLLDWLATAVFFLFYNHFNIYLPLCPCWSVLDIVFLCMWQFSATRVGASSLCSPEGDTWRAVCLVLQWAETEHSRINSLAMGSLPIKFLIEFAKFKRTEAALNGTYQPIVIGWKHMHCLLFLRKWKGQVCIICFDYTKPHYGRWDGTFGCRSFPLHGSEGSHSWWPRPLLRAVLPLLLFYFCPLHLFSEAAWLLPSQTAKPAGNKIQFVNSTNSIN